MKKQRNPLDELYLLTERLQQISEALHSGRHRRALEPSDLHGGKWVPAVDVVETGEAFVIVLEIPGVAREDVTLAIHGRDLTVRGKRPMGSADASFIRMERPHGWFHRKITLPADVREEGTTATLRQGTLEIRVPKVSTSTSRAISVH